VKRLAIMLFSLAVLAGFTGAASATPVNNYCCPEKQTCQPEKYCPPVKCCENKKVEWNKCCDHQYMKDMNAYEPKEHQYKCCEPQSYKMENMNKKYCEQKMNNQKEDMNKKCGEHKEKKNKKHHHHHHYVDR
jgi:hypothetical protein